MLLVIETGIGQYLTPCPRNPTLLLVIETGIGQYLDTLSKEPHLAASDRDRNMIVP